MQQWYVTHDTWHITHYKYGVVNILSKFKVPSSYGLGWTNHVMNERMNDGATIGLLHIETSAKQSGKVFNIHFQKHMWHFDLWPS